MRHNIARSYGLYAQQHGFMCTHNIPDLLWYLACVVIIIQQDPDLVICHIAGIIQTVSDLHFFPWIIRVEVIGKSIAPGLFQVDLPVLRVNGYLTIVGSKNSCRQGFTGCGII